MSSDDEVSSDEEMSSKEEGGEEGMTKQMMGFSGFGKVFPSKSPATVLPGQVAVEHSYPHDVEKGCSPEKHLPEIIPSQNIPCGMKPSESGRSMLHLTQKQIEGCDGATEWIAQNYVTEERCLKNNHVVGTQLTIGVEYKISVEVKPTRFVEGMLANVICFRNDITPELFGGIWFDYKGTGKIQIDMEVDRKTCTHNTLMQYSPNTWHKLEVMQRLVNSSYMYSITINNELVFSTINQSPEVFTGVNVYAGHNLSQSGFIRNFVVCSRADGVLDLSGPEEMQPGQITANTSSRPRSTFVDPQAYEYRSTGSEWAEQKYVTEEKSMNGHLLVGTELTIGMEYKISVEVRPAMGRIDTEETLTNVICFRNNIMPSLFGGIWLHGKDTGKIQVDMNVDGKTEAHNTEAQYLPNRWHKLEVMQRLDNSSYVYSITINDELVYSAINQQPEVFTGVTVHAAYNLPTSWITYFYIRNFTVSSPDEMQLGQMTAIASSTTFPQTITGKGKGKRKCQRMLWTEKQVMVARTFNPAMARREQRISQDTYTKINKARNRFFRTETQSYDEFLNCCRYKDLAVTKNGFEEGFVENDRPCNKAYFQMVFNGWLEVAPALGYWEVQKKAMERPWRKKKKKKKTKK